jgi:hypothetical protein
MDACIVSFKNVVVAETQDIDFTSAVAWWPAESVPRILFPIQLVVRNVVQHDVCLPRGLRTQTLFKSWEIQWSKVSYCGG